MLCQKCKKNNATIYYKENINGKVTEYSLCSDCAGELRKNGVLKIENPLHDLFHDNMFDFSPLFSGFFGELGSGKDSEKSEKHCPLCGSTFSDIARTGHIGCPQCYETFANELAPTINQLGAVKPTGRIPKRFGEKRSREAEIASLKAEMQSVIAAENFERAAELRDKIKALEAPAESAVPMDKTKTETDNAGLKESK